MNDIRKGGLKLINTTKTGFDPIYEMIDDAGSELSVLTTDSLKGFMISLKVNRHVSHYDMIDTDNGKFIRATNFLLKFAIITQTPNQGLAPYKGRQKAAETTTSFFTEAKMQYNIWKRSTMGVKPELCPSVANFSIFENDNAKLLLEYLLEKYKSDTPLFDVFSYLACTLKTYRLGLIVMPLIDESKTLLKIMQTTNGEMFNGVIIDLHEKGIIYAKIIAQVIRLFILGVVHLDLHSNNVLIYTDNKKIKTLLIDFGSASDIRNTKGDKFYSRGRKEDIDTKTEELTTRVNSMSIDVSDDEKIGFVKESLDEIINLDKEYAEKMTSDYYSEYQMDWCEVFKVLPPEYKVMSFDMLKEILMLPDQMIMSNNSFDNYEKAGHFIDFNKPITDFFVTFKHEVPLPKHNFTCTVSGGNRKSKTKRKRKYKKIKL